MYTRCPECNTLFNITAKQLAVAQGIVRCGQCLHVFSALEYLFDHASSRSQDSGAETPAAEHAPDTPKSQDVAETYVSTHTNDQAPGSPLSVADTEATEDHDVLTEEPSPEASADYVAIPLYTSDNRPQPPTARADFSQFLAEPGEEITDRDYLGDNIPAQTEKKTAAALPSADEAAATDTGVTAPAMATAAKDKEINAKEIIIEEITRRSKKRKNRGMTSTLTWSAVIFALLLLLAGQYAYFLRADLARYPELRPWIEKLCTIAQCDIPLQRDLAAIKITDRDVRVHPEIPGALLVNAILVNEAEFAQPFPTVEITLSSMEQARISSRRFKPNEYLDKKIDIAKGMPPHQAILMKLELTDPGKDVVNFEFEFY
ncbi:MAG: hypothetical protein A2V90_08195 [Gammaproteobacteria bacterium RBG_16_57_12]|nr:MAG: hypothetical protein A2V90_08195 [Gammaproteobacteria bacterium RBG_16_57_12]